MLILDQRLDIFVQFIETENGDDVIFDSEKLNWLDWK